MKRTKRIAALILAVIMAAALFAPAASAHTFKDVTKYSDAIDTLSKIKVIMGYDETTFKPDGAVERWHLALMVAKLHSKDCTSDTWRKTAVGYKFTDVEDYQFKSAIKYCVDNGFIVGRGGTIFDPKGKITLQEAVTMVVRALGYPREEYDKNWPTSYMAKAMMLGLLKGLEDVGYTQAITRGQAAQLLYNAFYLNRYNVKTGKETVEPFALNVYEYRESENAPVQKFSACDNYVLVATSEVSLLPTVSKASSGNLKFGLLRANGTIGALRSVAVNVVGNALGTTLADYNSCVGRSYRMAFNPEGVLISCRANNSRTLRSGLSVDGSAGAIELMSVKYDVVNSYSYDLELESVPSGRQIVIYGLNSIYNYKDRNNIYYCETGILTAAKMAGTTNEYVLEVFDDNGDGYYDRGVYTPYAFGKLTVNSDGTIPIALGAKAKLTGISADENDYVLYSYNMQSNELDISAVLPASSGMLTSVDTLLGTASIGGTKYSLGVQNLLNASRSEVMSSLPTSALLVEYVLKDGAIVYIVEQKTNTSGLLKPNNDYTSSTSSGRLGVVTEVLNSGSAGGNFPAFFGFVVTVRTVDASGRPALVRCGVKYLNGQLTKETGGTGALLLPSDSIKVGDVVEFSVNEFENISYHSPQYEVPLYSDVDAVNMYTVNNKPTFCLDNTTRLVYDSLDGKLVLSSRTSTGTDKAERAATSSTLIVLCDNNGNIQYRTVYELGSTELNIPEGYSIYTGTDLSGFRATDYILIVRPTAEGIDVSAQSYDSFIYISDGKAVSMNPAGNVASYKGKDVFTGQDVTVYEYGVDTLLSTKTPGYYRVANVNGIVMITDPNPLGSADEKNNRVGYTASALVSCVETKSGVHIIYIGTYSNELEKANLPKYMAMDAKYYYCAFGSLAEMSEANVSFAVSGSPRLARVFYKVVADNIIPDTVTVVFDA